MMQRNQILQAAIGKNLNMEQIGEKCKSAFSLIHQCIASISTMDLTEDEKRKKLIKSMQSFWRGTSQNIAGCKREYIQKIVKIAFGIGDEKSDCLREEMNTYTFQELYLYYCYIERIAQADTYFSKILRESRRGNIKKAIQEIEERQRKKEELERKINEMSKEERWRYDIFDRQQDALYYHEFFDSDTYSAEDKIIIARLLKEYWIFSDKWEDRKVSKRQVKKISKIKEILELHENL